MSRWTGSIISKSGNPSTSTSAGGIWTITDYTRYYSTGTWPGLDLYTFTSFTFTSAGIGGNVGPTLAQCLSSYNTATYPWLNNTAYFNVTAGIQLWTVPKTASYTIEAYGAAGGASSTTVARMKGTFSLTKGDKLRILVGQNGVTGAAACNNAMGGGGGGTFVMKETGSTISDIYVIAGGGGGKSANSSTTYYASITTSGNAGSDSGGAGGSDGNGGAYKSGQCVGNSGAGGGLLTDGGQNVGNQGGKAFVNGGTGGTGFNDYGGTVANGGFGGGGGTSSYMGGGGGGYSGGGSGGVASCSCASIGGGGGGGSYNNGTNQTNDLQTNNTGAGYVIITAL